MTSIPRVGDTSPETMHSAQDTLLHEDGASNEEETKKTAAVDDDGTAEDDGPALLGVIDRTFRIPLLRDPVNHEDPTKRKIDFAVRVGATLERATDGLVKIIQKEFGQQGSAHNSELNEKHSSKTALKSDLNGSLKYNITLTRRRRNGRKASLQPLPCRSCITEETSIVRFQRVARVVQVVLGICLYLKRYVKKSDTRTWSSVELYLHLQDDLNQKLAFNPFNFTMLTPPRKGEKLDQLLQIPPSERSPRDVKLILAYIRGHPSIHDYPADVQVRMCRCLLYHKYEDKRVLLKQGHPPSAFYFLLSGTLIVNIEDVNPNTGIPFTRTVSELTAGDCFGELALLERSTRTASVICKTTVELLVMLSEDFENIIRRPLLFQRISHVRFLQSLALFEDFPCESLASKPDDFFYQFIPEDAIVVKDSRECQYLIVVKSGKCSLVAPFSEACQRSDRSSPELCRELEKSFPYYTQVGKMNRQSKRPGSGLDQAVNDMRDTLDVGLLTGSMDRSQLGRPESRSKEGKESRQHPPPLRKSSTLSNFFEHLEQDRRSSVVKLGDDVEVPFWAMRLKGPSFRQMMSKRKAGSRSTYRAMSAQNMRKLDFLKENTRSAFAQVAELAEGAVFGLETLFRRPQSSLTVLSHGVECLFINKNVFLKMATIKTLRIVSDMVMTYPSQSFIREQVRVNRNWSNYKHSLIDDILKRL